MAETKSSKNSWQLSWSHEKYDYFDRMLQVKDGKDTFYQSWGRKPVTNIGRFKEHDTVYISCKKKCIAVGEIVEEFVEVESPSDESSDQPPSNKGRLPSENPSDSQSTNADSSGVSEEEQSDAENSKK